MLLTQQRLPLKLATPDRLLAERTMPAGDAPFSYPPQGGLD